MDQRDDGTWWADVQWKPAGDTSRIGTFAAEHVRPDETDWSRGRGS